jgi:hypothetical protein
MQYIYHYNQSTGEYLGKSPAQPDPETPGLYIVPANATLTPIPKLTKSTDLPIFENGQWSVMKDIRGKYYHTETQQETIVRDLDADISKLTKLKPQSPYDTWNGSKWIFDLGRYKNDKVTEASQQSFMHVESIFPAYKLSNIMNGVCIYDEPYTVENYRVLVSGCRDEFYRVKALIENASSKAAVDEALTSLYFPTMG